MGIFRQFPYTNFHDLNLDWLINKIKEITKEWLKYQEDWDGTREELEKLYIELQEYVNNYFEELDIPEQVNQIFNQLLEDGYFDSIINQAIINRTQINTRLVFSKFNPYTENEGAFPNGSCYIGNNKMAVYLSQQASNIGKLVIIDTLTFAIISETNLELNHGNSLTYDPEKGIIYATALYDVGTPSVILNKVFTINVTDINNPTLTGFIELPMPAGSTGVYSICYDQVTKQFGATIKSNPTGNVLAGQIDRIVFYNQDLTEITNTIFLKDFPITNNQGIQAFHNNKIYMNICDYAYMTIGVYDANDGTPITYYELPQFINGYRAIGEPESFTYDSDNDAWFCVSSAAGMGVAGHVCLSIFEMGLYKAIPNIKVHIKAYNKTGKTKPRINVYNGADGVSTDIETMYSLGDAINAVVLNNIEAKIYILVNSVDVGSIDINGFSGDIYGPSTNRTQIVGEVRIYNSNVRITYCDFTGSVTEESKTSSLFVQNSKFNFQACSFANGLVVFDSIICNVPVATLITAVRSIICSAGALTSATLTQSVSLINS